MLRDKLDTDHEAVSNARNVRYRWQFSSRVNWSGIIITVQHINAYTATRATSQVKENGIFDHLCNLESIFSRKYAGHTSENWWPITDTANVVQAVDKVATWHPCLFLSSSNIPTAYYEKRGLTLAASRILSMIQW